MSFVFCNQEGALNAAGIVIMPAASVKADAFYMHLGCACFAPKSKAA